MYRLGFFFLALSANSVFAVSPDPKSLAVPPGEILKARELVRKLGSESYVERESAHRELARMGRLARSVLAESAASTDAEVRLRSARLLPRAAEDDFKARLAAFQADTEERFEHDFPGWTQFKAVAGNSHEARLLFGEMLKNKANFDLLAGLAGPPEDLGKKIYARRTQLWMGLHNPGPGKMPKVVTAADRAVLLLVETEVPSRYIPPGIHLGVLLTNAGPELTAGGGDRRADVFRRLVSRWIDTRDDALSMYQALNVAAQHDINPAKAAVRLLNSEAATPIYRAQAALALAKMGERARDQLPQLEKRFEDGAQVRVVRIVGGASPTPVEIKVQDVALVAAVMISGQKTEDYGFHERYARSGNSALRLNYMNFYLWPDKRATAFAKWAEWRKKNPVKDARPASRK